MGIEDKAQPFNAEIGSILAGVELIAKCSQTRIVPLGTTQVRGMRREPLDVHLVNDQLLQR